MRSLLKRIISILKCGSLYKMCYSFTIFTDETFDKLWRGQLSEVTDWRNINYLESHVNNQYPGFP